MHYLKILGLIEPNTKCEATDPLRVGSSSNQADDDFMLYSENNQMVILLNLVCYPTQRVLIVVSTLKKMRLSLKPDIHETSPKSTVKQRQVRSIN